CRDDRPLQTPWQAAGMSIDPGTLFFAAGICAIALGLTILHAWLQNRQDRFLICWILGMLLIGASTIVYYAANPTTILTTAIAFTLQPLGFIAVYMAACRFIGK